MDILTHAFSVALIAQPLGSLLVGFGIIGTVLPDLDILLHPFSNRDPRLYIFSHGGFTHSLAGAVLISIAAFCSIALMQTAGFFSLPAETEFWILGLALIAGGSLLHVSLDYLAYPGIPLFYPFSDRKFTLGVFPGPSLFLTGASVIFLAFLITGVMDIEDISFWGWIFSLFLATQFIKWGISRYAFRDQMVIPTFHPLHWILVSEDDDKYVIRLYSVKKGIYENREYEKTEGVGNDRTRILADDFEVKRFRYFSYFTVAERTDDGIRLFDPLRVSGLIRYPPDFREHSVHSPAMRD